MNVLAGKPSRIASWLVTDGYCLVELISIIRIVVKLKKSNLIIGCVQK